MNQFSWGWATMDGRKDLNEPGTDAGGTLSTPPSAHGWQRHTRRAANQEPRTAPCVSTASKAYAEQVG